MTDDPPIESQELARRDFLRAGGALALGMLAGNSSIWAEEFTPPPSAQDRSVEAIGCAVIGLGEQGRALLSGLTHVPGVDMRYLCDHYEPAHRRALEIFPKARAVTQAKQVLDDPAVRAVWVATPTHLHRSMVIDALQAGKHVYCEAPLASTIDDARAIAQAARTAGSLVFHAGLPLRTEPQRKHVVTFVRVGALGAVVQAQAHWHRRTSWRRAAPNDERQHDLNWRLFRETSCGLMGEIGIHQIDQASWYLKALPLSVTGFGGIMAWDDGRTVNDTVQGIVEYPESRRLLYDATLASSYDASAEVFQGSQATVLQRDQRAWMIKEDDAPTMGWEVYAYREKIGDASGIALVADATKILAAGKQPGQNRDIDPARTPLACACDAFLTSIREKKPSACDAVTGFQATVTALKAHEATVTGSRIVFQKDWFEI